LLYWLTNPLTMWLTLVSLVGYAVVYTLYLKRATPQNIVIGGAAGAAPPLLGWTAVTGEVHAHALILFLIIFAWTPPHFWALAIDRRAEYAKVGIPMLPVTHGVYYTSQQILLYTLILFAVSLLPFGAKMSGWLYLAGAVPLGGLYLMWAWRLARQPREEQAQDALPKHLFNYSIVYLMAIFALLLLDHYLMPLIS
jgi:protoheme IX farnesyltransferase